MELSHERPKNVTMQQIADIVGVSKTTVSRYINGYYDKMSEETRKQIANTVRELNYRPSWQAKGLKTNQSYLIGLVLNNSERDASYKLISCLSNVFSKTNYQLIIREADGTLNNEKEIIETLLDYNIDGLIIQPASSLYNDYIELASYNIPLVLIGKELSRKDWPVLKVSYFDVLDKVRSIIEEKDYTKIIFLSSLFGREALKSEFILDFKIMLTKSNINYSEIFTNDTSMTKEVITTIKTDDEKVLCVTTDLLALDRMIGVFELNNITIEKDAGLLVYDKTGLMDLDNYSLSSINEDYEKISDIVLDQLMYQLDRKSCMGKVYEVPAVFSDRSSF